MILRGTNDPARATSMPRTPFEETTKLLRTLKLPMKERATVAVKRRRETEQPRLVFLTKFLDTKNREILYTSRKCFTLVSTAHGTFSRASIASRGNFIRQIDQAANSRRLIARRFDITPLRRYNYQFRLFHRFRELLWID